MCLVLVVLVCLRMIFFSRSLSTLGASRTRCPSANQLIVMYDKMMTTTPFNMPFDVCLHVCVNTNEKSQHTTIDSIVASCRLRPKRERDLPWHVDWQSHINRWIEYETSRSHVSHVPIARDYEHERRTQPIDRTRWTRTWIDTTISMLMCRRIHIARIIGCTHNTEKHRWFLVDTNRCCTCKSMY
jgi:hypothetical protein